jgi:hypothetical protein
MRLHNHSRESVDTERHLMPSERSPAGCLVDHEKPWLSAYSRHGPRFPAVGVLNARDALQALLEEVEDEESLLLKNIMGNRIPLTSSQRRRGIP